jgi:hypothetical protein
MFDAVEHELSNIVSDTYRDVEMDTYLKSWNAYYDIPHSETFFEFPKDVRKKMKILSSFTTKLASLTLNCISNKGFRIWNRFSFGELDLSRKDHNEICDTLVEMVHNSPQHNKGLLGSLAYGKWT